MLHPTIGIPCGVLAAKTVEASSQEATYRLWRRSLRRARCKPHVGQLRNRRLTTCCTKPDQGGWPPYQSSFATELAEIRIPACPL